MSEKFVLRNCFWLLTVLLFASVHLVQAQQLTKVPRFGILNAASPSSNSMNTDAFRQGLRELGYVEGKSIVLEYRHAQGDLGRLANLASELVQSKVDVIVTGGTQTTTAAKHATSTIPIVVGGAGDLLAAGLVASLARPGGNVTGSTRMSKDLSGKRIEVLKEAIPKVSRLAALLSSATTLLDRDELKEMEIAARHLGMKLQPSLWT